MGLLKVFLYFYKKKPIHNMNMKMLASFLTNPKVWPAKL